MTAQSPPAYLQASSHSAALFRQQIAALLGLAQPGTLGIGIGGVPNAGDLLVTQNGTPNMSVNVAGGVAVMPQTIGANGGVYTGLNDATVNLAIAASNPTNPRIDIVVATVHDAAYSGGVNNWVLQVITGTPAGSPVAPATPASSILLAKVAVAALAGTIVTANITDSRSQLRQGLPPELSMVQAGNAASTNTSSSVYVPMGGGPAVTLVAPFAMVALVLITANMQNDTIGDATLTSFDVSGATTIAASDQNALWYVAPTANLQGQFGGCFPVSLNAGSNVFTMDGRVTGGTGHWINRQLAVIPIL
jgi:hypothetical protein